MPWTWVSSATHRGWRAATRASLLGALGTIAGSSCTFPEYGNARSMGTAGQAGGGGTSNTGGSTRNEGGVASDLAGTSNGGAGGNKGGGGGSTSVGGALAGTNQGGSEQPSGDAGAAGSALAGAGGSGESGPLLFDDFEDGNDNGWIETSADWRVTDDGATKVYQIANLKDATLFTVAGDLTWSDVAVEARVKLLQYGGSTASDLVAVFARYQNPSQHYYVALQADGRLSIRYKAGANFTIGTPYDAGLKLNVYYLVKLEIIGSKLTAYLDGVPVLTVTDTHYSEGRIALGADNGRANFDDVTVTQL